MRPPSPKKVIFLEEKKDSFKDPKSNFKVESSTKSYVARSKLVSGKIICKFSTKYIELEIKTVSSL